MCKRYSDIIVKAYVAILTLMPRIQQPCIRWIAACTVLTTMFSSSSTNAFNYRFTESHSLQTYWWSLQALLDSGPHCPWAPHKIALHISNTIFTRISQEDLHHKMKKSAVTIAMVCASAEWIESFFEGDTVRTAWVDTDILNPHIIWKDAHDTGL